MTTSTEHNHKLKRSASRQWLSLRVTRSEKAWLITQSKNSGISLSEYMRRRVFNRPVLSRTDDVMVRELRRLGGLLKCHFSVIRQSGAGKQALQHMEDTLARIGERLTLLGKEARPCSTTDDSKEN